MTWAVILFAVAAVGGLTMLFMRFNERPVPLGLALGHGLLAAIALIIVAVPVLQGGASGLVVASVVLFVLAALGGFVLFASHLRTGSFPLQLAVGHGLTAVVAFVLLLIALYG